MVARITKILLGLVGLAALYFLFWPVPIDPVSWQAPSNPGFTGSFSVNHRLGPLEFLDIGGSHGPEDIALDRQGRIYAATHGGEIVRLQPNGGQPEIWARTGGRPLGIDFDADGDLIVADAYQGLLSFSPKAEMTVLTRDVAGEPIRYADDVDVAADGRIYFSDASTKFGAKEWGGTYEASLLDLMEHGGHGRLLVYDPATRKTAVLAEGINFANGVAVSPDQRFVLVNETGRYRVLRHWIAGPKKGQTETLIENLPGFPDNISTGADGRFWVAFASPRNPVLDGLADKPFLRRMVQRLPALFRPKAEPYGHIVAIGETGRVLIDLQDPDGLYPVNTSVTEAGDFLYIGSLMAPVLARLSKDGNGF